MSSGATAPAYLQLVAPFESAAKLKAVTLALSDGVGAANIATRVRGDEAVDVLFLSDGVMDDMIREGHVVPAVLSLRIDRHLRTTFASVVDEGLRVLERVTRRAGIYA